MCELNNNTFCVQIHMQYMCILVAYTSPLQQSWYSSQLQLRVCSKLIVWALPPEVMQR